MNRIGIDLGGTKIEGVWLTEDGSVGGRERIPTPRDDYDGTLQAISALVERLEQQAGRCSVGVGHPGATDPERGVIKNANSTWIIGKKLREDLCGLLGREVVTANDADCLALSEATDGAGAGHAVVFGVILGTGVGGGIVTHGKLLSGPNAITGEWGHNPLPWPRDEERPGPDCYCRRRGCIETYLSGPGLAADHERVTGEQLTAEQVHEQAEKRVLTAETTLRRYEHRLARALAAIINVLDPDVIVLGGGLSNLKRVYNSLPHIWNEFAFTGRVVTPVKPPQHGDSSGVRGAAWLGASGAH